MGLELGGVRVFDCGQTSGRGFAVGMDNRKLVCVLSLERVGRDGV